MTDELVRDLARDWLRGEAVQAMVAVGQLDDADGSLAVRADQPECAAIGLYQAAGFDHPWLVITAKRLAVLRLLDTELDCPFEVPRFALESIVPWQRAESEVDGGQRFIQVEFTDASWARLRTDQTGLRVLTGSD